MLTAKSTLESRLKGLQIGADAYLNKPFSVEELQIRIDKLISLPLRLCLLVILSKSLFCPQNFWYHL